ncbi:nuclear transport factor 2 family protein [Sphingopyxis sp. 550A]
MPDLHGGDDRSDFARRRRPRLKARAESSPGGYSAMPSIESEIDVLETRRAEAIVGADLALLAAMVDEHYIHVDADGALRDKAGYLGAVCSRAGRYVDYRVTENHVRLIDDLAVVHGCFENRFEATDGTTRDKSGRHVRLYSLHADGWRNFFHQSTLIAPDAG